MTPESFLERNILDNLLDGVVIVGVDGVIRTVNPAAAEMFGLDRNETVGRTFLEAFIAIEGFDEFAQAVLDAVSDRGLEGRQVVRVRRGEESRSLAVAISYMEVDDRRDVESVIVVVSDVTELAELRESQIRLAERLKEQNVELKKAYREVEKGNADLNHMLKRVQVARVAATVMVIGLFLGVGAWGWGVSDLAIWSDGPDLGLSVDAQASGEIRAVTIQPNELQSTVSLVGRLRPWRQETLRSPVEGNVRSLGFEYGQTVEEGDRLIEFDTLEVELERQSVLVEYQKALNAVSELDNWENSSKVSAAQRSYTKARMSLDRLRNRVKTSAFLLEEGLISASEHADLELNLQNQLLDFEAVEQDLAAARAEGGEEARRIAALELETAESRLRSLEESLQMKWAIAPISGIVKPPNRSGPLSRGKVVQKGDLLVEIADFARMAVVTQVDEVEVTRVRPGQPVTVVGDAFPDLVLPGEVSYVSASSDSRSGSRGGVVQFEVVATLEPLGEADRERLREGMSAQVEIVVYRNPEALLVPIDSVRRRGGGHSVQVVNPATGQVDERPVVVGLTTLSEVEVLEGLAPGEDVVLPDG